jgi:hypothetical protein
MKRLILSLLLLPLTSISFAMSLTPLNRSAATSEIADKTMTTISAATLDGKVIADSFTGYFGKDGKMMGKFANAPTDGPQSDQGTWLVKSDGKVCVTWQHWNNAKEKCVALYKLSNALLIVNASNGFESLVLASDLKPGNQMPQ